MLNYVNKTNESQRNEELGNLLVTLWLGKDTLKNIRKNKIKNLKQILKLKQLEWEILYLD